MINVAAPPHVKWLKAVFKLLLRSATSSLGLAWDPKIFFFCILHILCQKDFHFLSVRFVSYPVSVGWRHEYSLDTEMETNKLKLRSVRSLSFPFTLHLIQSSHFDSEDVCQYLFVLAHLCCLQSEDCICFLLRYCEMSMCLFRQRSKHPSWPSGPLMCCSCNELHHCSPN